MYYNESEKQWLASGHSDTMVFGEKLRDEILEPGKEIFPAGMVMVFAFSGKPYMMFQTLQELYIDSLRNSDLVAYENGSIVYLQDREFIPTIRFRDCRIPTLEEYVNYIKQSTI